MLKIKMPANYKKQCTLAAIEIFKEISEDCKEMTKKEIMEDINRALALVTNWGDFEILKTEFQFNVSAFFSGYEMDAYNSKGQKLNGDIWVTVYAFNAYVGFVRLGFNLFNFYQLIPGVNDEEIKSNMFIKVYKENKC